MSWTHVTLGYFLALVLFCIVVIIRDEWIKDREKNSRRIKYSDLYQYRVTRDLRVGRGDAK